MVIIAAIIGLILFLVTVAVIVDFTCWLYSKYQESKWYDRSRGGKNSFGNSKRRYEWEKERTLKNKI